MAAPISDTVKINITADTPKLTQQGFGTTVMFGYVNHLTDRVKAYSSVAELIADGYTSAHEVYKKMVKHLSQDRKPSQFKVARIAPNANSIQKITLVGTFSGGVFKIGVGGVNTADIAFDADAAAIKAAIELLVAVTEVTVVRATSAVITIEFSGSTDGNKHWDPITVDVSGLTATPPVATITQVQYGSAVETLDVAFSAAKEEDNDFFGMICSQTCSDSEVLATAALVQTDVKSFVVLRKVSAIASATYNESAPSDLAEKMKALGYTKTDVVWTATDDNFIDAAITGLQLTKTPGSSTYMFRQLVGVVADKISTTQRNNLRSKNCNFYESQNGISIFKDGVAPSGEFIDIVIGIDYLTARMGETVFAGLAQIEKVDYETPGLDIIESLMLTALYNFGVKNNLIVETSILIILPDLTKVPAQDKAARILREVKFTATLKGAIHTLYIDGSLTV